MIANRTLRKFGNSKASPEPVETQNRVRWSREWFYFLVVIASWCFNPLFRRLLDWHNGFYNPIQLTSVIPFALTIPLAITCFRPERIARMTPAFKIFAIIWAASFGYGLIVGIFVGNFAAAAYEAVQYTIPMLIGLWLAGQELDNPEMMQRRLTPIMLTVGGIVAAYGLVQFVQPAPWDILWVQGSGLTSMGAPVPFGLRIFSTLNSSGPAGDFFVMVIILALPLCSLKRIWILPFVALVGAALLLTLGRAAWIALVFGFVTYLIISPRRFSTIPFITLLLVLMGFLVTALPSFLGAGTDSDIVSSRISTLADVGHDTSALGRSTEIEDAINQGLANPFGTGLGMLGASSALSANPDTPHGNNLDSGYMSRFIELGWLGFSGYLIVVIGSFSLMLVALARPERALLTSIDAKVVTATAAALCAALLWSDAAGDSHLGIDGVFFWIAVGTGLRRVLPNAKPEASAPSRSSEPPLKRRFKNAMSAPR